jgi:putative restriction endonuclease
VPARGHHHPRSRNALHRAEPPDEIDFRRPSPHGFKAIPPGAPFFFRLARPTHKAIAGYGFFARYERVPVWLAWGC